MEQPTRTKLELILGIDTSCDDTSVAVSYKTKVLSNIISSQIEMHRQWGGIVPGLAKREHEARIDRVVEEALKQAIINLNRYQPELKTSLRAISLKTESWAEQALGSMDAFAVTYGPGLSIALEVGIKKAKELAIKYKKPLIGVNHMEGHLLSSLAQPIKGENKIGDNKQKFPALAVLLSGGHTELVEVKNIGEYKIIGQTLDDAIGEAFDKAARILGLGYPGGKIISELSKSGSAGVYPLPIPMARSDDLDVSYSGLKTALLYKVRDLKGEKRKQDKKPKQSWKPDREHIKQSYPDKILTKRQIYDLSAAFEDAAIQTILNKIKKAIQENRYYSILLGGGVINNANLRKQIRKLARSYDKSLQVLFPYSNKLFQDNAAMISVAAYLSSLKNNRNVYRTKDKIEMLDRVPNLRLS